MNDVYAIAKIMNEHTASQKDWRLNATGRKLREIARNAIDFPIVGTAREIGDKFSSLDLRCTNWDKVADHRPEDVFVWAIDTFERAGRRTPYIACVGQIDR